MTALRSRSGAPRTGGDNGIITGTVASWTGGRVPVICAHGSGVNADGAWHGTYQKVLFDTLAQTFTVSVADLGNEAWGNDTHRSRIAGEQTILAAAPWSCTGLPILIATSMGALGALGRVQAAPTQVRGVICAIPALDLNDLHANNRGGVAALINAAYGGAYNNATHGPTYSPVQYAASLPANLPIHLFTSDDDPVAVPATADAFMTARPQTVRHPMGNVGHGDASLNGFAAAIAAVAVSMI